MRVRCAAICAAALLAMAQPASAQVALALRAGTFGPSLGLMAGLGERTNVRVDVPYLDYEYSSTGRIGDFDLDYTTGVKLFSVSAIADLHPFRNGFRVSIGGVYNANEATFVGGSSASHTVGGQTFTPQEIGELSGTVELGSRFAPYGGIGFGNALGGSKRFGFVMDIGVMYQGKPKVTMEGTGMIAPTVDQAPVVENNLDWATLYPGFSIGITYRLR